MLLFALLFLFAACTQDEPEWGGELPYRVWQSREEMKGALGDHYLYPTHLPETTLRSDDVFKSSWYNPIPRDSKSGELFFGYSVYYYSDWPNDRIFIRATDYGRMIQHYSRYNTASDIPPLTPTIVPGDIRFQSNDRFNEHTVTIGGIDIKFTSFYALSPLPEGQIDPDEWFRYRARNGRAVLYEFKIDTVIYRMSWTQNNVEDKYADDEQREGMIRVAKSIIEQVREIE